MDLQPLNVDDQILSTMGDGNLSNLIAQTPYGAGSDSNLNEGASLAMANDPGPGGIAQGGNVFPGGQGQQSPGLATGQIVQQGPPPAAVQQNAVEIQRLQEVAFRSAQAKIDAEERAFRAEIADLPEHEQELEITKRQLGQTTQVNQWLNQERLTARQQAQAQQEDLARRQYGFLVAHEAGLPFTNEGVRQALLSARDKNHMREIAQQLVGAMNGGQALQVQQQVNQHVFAAGGNTGAAAPGPRAVPYSGDLDSLVASRNYQMVNWG